MHQDAEAQGADCLKDPDQERCGPRPGHSLGAPPSFSRPALLSFGSGSRRLLVSYQGLSPIQAQRMSVKVEGRDKLANSSFSRRTGRFLAFPPCVGFILRRARLAHAVSGVLKGVTPQSLSFPPCAPG